MKIHPPSQLIDVLVIGTGAAGFGVALGLPSHFNITLISKDSLQTGASPRAQGGIAAVMEQSDHVNAHIQDTLIAGAGLCDLDTVDFTVKNAKSAIDWLITQGVQFTKNGAEYHLTQEGGHSHRRVLHAADKTGDVVVRTLTEQIKAKSNITCLTQHTAIDLIIEDHVCLGATVLNNSTGDILTFVANTTILATGGASSVYQHTSNPDAATGDGIAMAWRAGCTIANLEFNQFHPTCLYYPNSSPFLITEAIRGEGGILRLPNGKRFMPDYDPRAELAPRDIVTRAIDAEMKKHAIKHVYLDVTHFPAQKIETHFPTIAQHCSLLDIDITKQPIPVVPAAHYTCGGVYTDLKGRTNIQQLFAVGEVAYTGLHGANRMASNSLLECLVFAASCAQEILASHRSHSRSTTALPLAQQEERSTQNSPHVNETNHNDHITALIQKIQKIMWGKVGIIRTNSDLESALSELQTINNQINSWWGKTHPNRLLIEARNLALTALLITKSAISRKESRGLHFNSDYPHSHKNPKITLLRPADNSL